MTTPHTHADTWFEAKWDRDIDPVQVVRSTAVSVFLASNRRGVEEQRCAKVSDWRSYFPTWEEARAHLLEKAETAVAQKRRELQAANDLVGNLKGMKKPGPVEAMAKIRGGV